MDRPPKHLALKVLRGFHPWDQQDYIAKKEIILNGPMRTLWISSQGAKNRKYTEMPSLLPSFPVREHLLTLRPFCLRVSLLIYARVGADCDPPNRVGRSRQCLGVLPLTHPKSLVSPWEDFWTYLASGLRSCHSKDAPLYHLALVASRIGLHRCYRAVANSQLFTSSPARAQCRGSWRKCLSPSLSLKDAYKPTLKLLTFASASNQPESRFWMTSALLGRGQAFAPPQLLEVTKTYPLQDREVDVLSNVQKPIQKIKKMKKQKIYSRQSNRIKFHNRL